MRAMLMWILLRVGMTAARVLPLRVSYALARIGGTVGFWVWRGGRRRCIENMEMVTGGDAKLARRYARQSFENYGLFLVDFLRELTSSLEATRGRVVFDGWSTLEELRTGNGLVFVTLHFGNWDMGAAGLALHGLRPVVVADEFKNPRIDRMVRRYRERLGMTVIPARRVGPGVLRALLRNEVVATLADVPAADGAGVAVEFFGEQLVVPVGAARIALRAGASVVVAMAPRLSAWSDEVEAWVAPVEFKASGDADADAQALTQAIFRELESMVRRAPTQWYIFRTLQVAHAPSGQ
jgi:KDO2-lipid IV(A) lauroyltransferase